MLGYVLTILKSKATRHYVRVMAFAVFGLVTGAFVVYVFLGIEAIAPVIDDVQTTERAISPFVRSAPVRLRIPKIDIDTTFVPPLGLNADKTVSVPDSYTEVGWYKNGATPGEIGASVILGHVDSYQGPAVFYSLGQLKKGDEIEITREDGSVATFVVTDKERVTQDNFPTEKVYGAVNYAGLRLVTCTGIYNRGSLRYSHNLIVYAELKNIGNKVE